MILGKTNMDEFAMGSSNETSFFGPVKNPWDRTRVPGGSSGGSAAAVAARLCAGGDRHRHRRLDPPAGGAHRHLRLKPTYGVVSRYGMIAFASSLDQGGPMAQEPREDLALMLNVMAGFDERDSTSLERPAEDYTRLSCASRGSRQAAQRPAHRRAEGVLRRRVWTATSARPWKRRWRNSKTGRKASVESACPIPRLSVPAYYVIAPAEASSNLSRFDGVRYGYRAPEYTDLADMYRKTRAQGFGAEVKRRILIGTYVLSHGYYDAYYLKAQKIRRLIAQDFAEAFKQCDLIMGPTTPSVAFELGAKGDDPVQMYLSTSTPSRRTSPACRRCRFPAASAKAACRWGCSSSATISPRRAC